ncbi:hypothetical protein ACI796_02235 [Geodermatophilus sp. SYSU D00525]
MHEQDMVGSDHEPSSVVVPGLQSRSQDLASTEPPPLPGSSPVEDIGEAKPRWLKWKTLVLGAALVTAACGAILSYLTWPTAEDRKEQAAFDKVRAEVPALQDASDDRLQTMMEATCTVLRNDGLFGLMGLISQFNLGPGDMGILAGQSMMLYCTDVRDELSSLGED